MNELSSESLFDSDDKPVCSPESMSMEEQVEASVAQAEIKESVNIKLEHLDVYQAMHAIYGEIPTLEHTEQKTGAGGNYSYAKADQFRDLMRALFFKHGLIDRMSEQWSSAGKEGSKRGDHKYKFEFWLIHVASGTVTDKVLKSVTVPYVGSTTAGAAATFAWKEWVKNEFNISTGETDPEKRMEEADHRTIDRLSVEESGDVFEFLDRELTELQTKKAEKKVVMSWKEGVLSELGRLHQVHYDKLCAKYWKIEDAAK